MSATQVLQVLLPSGVGLVAAVVTPIALYAQQKQQNKREIATRRLDDERADRTAHAASVERERESKRLVYAAAVRAVGRYRASGAVFVARVEQAAVSQERRTETTRAVWQGFAPEFPTVAFAKAQEAVAEARLAAAGNGETWVSDLDSALQNSVHALIPSSMPCAQAWSRWEDLQRTRDAFVIGAALSLDEIGRPSPAQVQNVNK